VIEPLVTMGIGASLLMIAAILSVYKSAMLQCTQQLQVMTTMSNADILTEAERHQRKVIETMKIEKDLIEAQLCQSLEENARLQHQLDCTRRETESIWAVERMETAVMRERINDVAAEIDRLTRGLEGSILSIEMNRIDAKLTRASATSKGNIQKPIGLFANGEGLPGTLSNRIRALQRRP
jgi:hypothetical protein